MILLLAVKEDVRLPPPGSLKTALYDYSFRFLCYMRLQLKEEKACGEKVYSIPVVLRVQSTNT